MGLSLRNIGKKLTDIVGGGVRLLDPIIPGDQSRFGQASAPRPAAPRPTAAPVQNRPVVRPMGRPSIGVPTPAAPTIQALPTSRDMINDIIEKSKLEPDKKPVVKAKVTNADRITEAITSPATAVQRVVSEHPEGSKQAAKMLWDTATAVPRAAIEFGKKKDANMGDLVKGITGTGIENSPVGPAYHLVATGLTQGDEAAGGTGVAPTLTGAEKSYSQNKREKGAAGANLDLALNALGTVGAAVGFKKVEGKVPVTAKEQVTSAVKPGAATKPSVKLKTAPATSTTKAPQSLDELAPKITNKAEYNAAVKTYATKAGVSQQDAETAVKGLVEKARIATVEQTKAAPKVPFKEPITIEGKAVKNPVVQDVLGRVSKARGGGSVEESLTASKVASEARRLKVKIDHGFIERYQSGGIVNAKEKQLADFIRTNVTDPLFETQKKLNPEIVYRKNYVPQSYSNTAEQVAEAAKRLQTDTGAATPRAFNTYAEARSYGLKPKYDTLDQILGANAGEAQRALANRDVIQHGLEQGLFDTVPRGGRAPVTGFYDAGGNQIYAQKSVADVFNGVTQRGTNGLDKVVSKTAKVSGKLQDVALQGGIPGTNFNFFTAGQAIKDTTRNIGKLALHPVQAVKQEGNIIGDLFRGYKGTQKRFAKNADFVKAMSDRGLHITPQTALSNADDGIASQAWDMLGNNPTFGRFMPNRLLSTSQEVYTQSLKKLGHEGALDLAADTTKAFNGIVDQIAKGRSNLTQDAITSVAFAPKYREAVINSLGNVVKSMTTEVGNKAFRPSRQLLAGMALTLAGYEALNQKINGHSMFENRKGQELSLQIPYGEKDEKGNQPVINIPFMPGYMTIPRAIVSGVNNAIHGDAKGVVAEVSKGASMPLQIGGRLLGNQDYFGNPIYNDQAVADKEGVEPDSAGKAAGKVAAYVGGQLSPAWVRGAADYFGPAEKPAEQAIATALEAPVKFGKVTNPDTVSYFDTKDKFYKSLNRNERSLYDKLNPTKKDINGDSIAFDSNSTSTAAKYADLVSNPEFAGKYQDYQKSQGSHDPLWDLNPKELRAYMMAQVIGKYNPGGDSKTTTALYDQVPADLFTKREQYFAGLKDKGVALPTGGNAPRPKMPDNLVKFSENYHTLPYGTGARSAALRSPEGVAYIAYLDANRLYNNQERADLGLPPLDDPSSDYASSGKGKKGGGRSKAQNAASDPYKYAVSLKAGGSAAKPKVSARNTGAPKGKGKVAAKGGGKAKVSIKKSLV